MLNLITRYRAIPLIFLLLVSCVKSQIKRGDDIGPVTLVEDTKLSSESMTKMAEPVPLTKKKNLDEIILEFEEIEQGKTEVMTPKNQPTPASLLPEASDGEHVQTKNPKLTFMDSVDINLNRHIMKWINYFTQKGRPAFQRYMNRGHRYQEVVNSILNQYDLPEELYYLAMIESGFTVDARSKARAVGLWQFISGTAKRYDLAIDWYVDERKDPIRATEAAAKYLKDLYNAFQSWELAMAAYNCGELRVLRAIMKGDTRDFWHLVKKNLLPRETRNYVPKFIAAVIIGTDPEKYGFASPDQVDRYPDVEAIELPSPIKLSQVAGIIDMSYQELHDLNPHLEQKITPANRENYELWIPKNKMPLYLANQGALQGLKLTNYTLRSPSSRSYRVRRGDNLITIARRLGTTVSYLRRINNLRSNRINAGQILRATTQRFAHKNDTHYIVKPGDYLGSIARRHLISVTKLKQMNGIVGNRIFAGQKIVLAGGGIKRYKVKSGDSLHRIANLFNLSVKQIKKMNGLRNNKIIIGQMLSL